MELGTNLKMKKVKSQKTLDFLYNFCYNYYRK